MYMGVTTFGPAAALESVTDIPIWINIFAIMGVCTIYTSIVSHVQLRPEFAIMNTRVVRIVHIMLHCAHNVTIT